MCLRPPCALALVRAEHPDGQRRPSLPCQSLNGWGLVVNCSKGVNYRMARDTLTTDVRALRRARLAGQTPYISVVIPARNEATNLSYVLPRIPSDVFEVILVDGHSTDDTIAVAKRLWQGIRIVAQAGRGKGDALREGFAACRGDIVVMLDADGSTDPQEIPRFVSALLQGADFAKGSRYLAGGGSADISVHRSAGNRGLSMLVNRLFATRYTDLCYGFNAFWRDCLECIEVDCDGFEVETLLNIRARRSALVVSEVPSFEYQRIDGASNLHPVRDGLRVLKTVLTEWWSERQSTAPVARAGISTARRDRLEALPTLHLPVVAASARPITEGSLPAPAPQASREDHESSVAVIVAAYTQERWPHLRQVIAALQAQTRRPDEIILVIDDNPALYHDARAAFAGVRVVANARSHGLSGARNTAVNLTSADYVAFIDDDATPEPDWLAGLLAACESSGALGAGGALEPTWQTGRPAWFPDEFGWVVGCSYVGLPERQAPVRNLIGASMCMRRSVFDVVGGFREDMGRVGRLPVGCEETEWCVRAQQTLLGGHFRYEPRANAHHYVPEARARLSYFSSRCYHEGISKALVVASVGAEQGLAAERRHALRTLPRGVARGLRQGALEGDATGFLRALALLLGLALTMAGYAAGRLSLARDAAQGWLANDAARQDDRPVSLKYYACPLTLVDEEAAGD